MKTSLRLCALAAAAATILPATAVAAPVTATLRIEGPNGTLFEGPVTTDVRDFHFTGDATSYQCDATVATGGSSATPRVTRGAILAAAIDAGLQFNAVWSTQFKTIDVLSGPVTVAGQNLEDDLKTGAYLGEYLNGQFTFAGACTDPVVDGDEALFAYAAVDFPPPTYDPVPPTLLKLQNVPARLAPGATATAKVTTFSGDPIAGATVDGRVTGADGTVQIGPFTSTGPRILKAERSGAVRSNGGQVCVTDGADGACGTVKPIAATPQSTTTGTTGCTSFGDDGRCGTPDEMPPLVRLTNITSTTYPSAKAPRELKGQAGNFKNGTEFLSDPSGLKDVKLRITRYVGGKCWTFDGAAEQFTRLSSCGTGKGKYFSIGNKAEWSYLLPAALKPGKYRIEAFAIDNRGNADKVRRWNRNHVVFRVTK